MKSFVVFSFSPRLFWVFFGFFLFLGSCQSKKPNQGTATKEERPSFDPKLAQMKFQLLNGEMFDLQLENKKWTVLHFWATWCKPCLVEFPELKKALPNLQQDHTQFIFASEEDLEQIQAFEKRHQTGINLSRFSKGTLADLEIYVLPTTLILDSQGKEVFRQVGLIEWENIDRIEDLINSKP